MAHSNFEMFDFTFQLCDILFDLNLFKYVDKPNHVHGNILDVILANNNFVSDIKVLDTQNLLSSFCFSTCGLFAPSVATSKQSYFLDFASADWDQMNMYFSNCDFFNNSNFEDVEEVSGVP